MKFLHLACKNIIKRYKQRRMSFIINFMIIIFLKIKQKNKNKKLSRILQNNNGVKRKILKKKIYILILI